jgi:hypothetical protein
MSANWERVEKRLDHCQDGEMISDRHWQLEEKGVTRQEAKKGDVKTENKAANIMCAACIIHL